MLKPLYYFFCQIPPCSFDFCKNFEFQQLKYPNHMYISFCAFVELVTSRRQGSVSATGFVPMKIEILTTYLG